MNGSAPQLSLSLSPVISDLNDKSLACLQSYPLKCFEIAPKLFLKDKQLSLFKAWCQANNITIASVHIPFGSDCDVSSCDSDSRDGGIANIISCIELANTFNAHHLVLHASYEPVNDDERSSRIAQCESALSEVGPKLKDNNLTMGIEILPRSCIGNTAEELVELLNDLDPTVFGACLDVNHLMDRYKTLPSAVNLLGSRLMSLHLSDYDGVDEKHWLPNDNGGVIDWDQLVKALIGIKFDGLWTYECKLPQGNLDKTLMQISKNQHWLRTKIEAELSIANKNN